MIAKFKKFKKTSSVRTVFTSVILGLFFVAVIGFLIFSNWRIGQRRGELTAKVNSLKEQIEALEEKNQALKAGIVQTEEEEYWKEKLYEQGYVGKGEQQVVILPPEEEETSEEEEKNFWNPQNWWEWLKNKISR